MQRRPGGGIGRRTGLKIPRREACRFDSGPGHNFSVGTTFSLHWEQHAFGDIDEVHKLAGSIPAPVTIAFLRTLTKPLRLHQCAVLYPHTTRLLRCAR